MNEIDTPVVACGFLEQGLGATPGVKYNSPNSSSVGATVVSAGVGIRQVTLNAPNTGLNAVDVTIVATVNTAPTFGVTCQTTQMSSGVFSIITYKAEAADQILIDVPVSFRVEYIPRQR